MATLIRLRSPRNKVQVIDPAEHDVSVLLKKGWSRAGDVMVPAHTRAFPQRKKQEQTFTPAETSAAGITPETVQREEPWLVSQLPNIGGIAGDITGRVVGGGIGLAAGAASSAPTGGVAAPATVPAGVALGQEIGGPVGSALFGGGAEAVRQLIDRAIGIDAPATPQEAAGEIGKQALIQGGSSLVGSGLGHGAKLTGKAAMGAALKFTPEAAQTAIREGITVTKGGMRKLGARLGEYGQQMISMLRHSTNIGNRFDPQVFLNGAEQSLADMLTKDRYGNLAASRLPEHGEMVAKFQELSNEFLRNNSSLGDMTPIELQRIKTEADKIASPLWEAINRHEPLIPVDRAKAYWYKALADHARDLLEKTTPDMINPKTGKVMKLAEVNALNSSLMKLKEAMVPIVDNQMGTGARVVTRVGGPIAAGTAASMIPGGNNRRDFVLGAGAAAMMQSPTALSLLAHALSSPAAAEALRLVPRAGAVLVTEPRKSGAKK